MMATLAENAAAVKAAQVAIDAAIVAKGGTTTGGLSNAAAAIAALPSGGGEPSWPVDWKNDGKTHLWFWFGTGAYPLAYFSAQYVSDGHTFDVDWGDGTVDSVAASTTLTSRAVSHLFSERGLHEVVISGYDEISLTGMSFGGSRENLYCPSKIRQIEIYNPTPITFPSNNSVGVVAVKCPLATIGESAFRFNADLTTLEGTSACTEIAGYSFQGCNSLVSLGDFPNVTTIGSAAIQAMNNLESIGDLSSLASVGLNAFDLSPKIKSLTFASKTHSEVEAITGFYNFPNRGTACVFHCSDGDFYRSGSSLLPVA